MDRRHFLKSTSLTGLSLTGLAIAGYASATTGRATTHPANQEPHGPAQDGAFPLQEATIDDLQQKMKKGQYTSRSITEAYLSRIGQIDQAGPTLHAVIELNPDALAIADERDRERKAGKVRGPLHGIPMLVKDNIDTGDKMMTTAGSLALEGHKAAQDATIIQKLREAGAVLLGKTNLSEWANFRSEQSTSGWSSRGGQTRCPYILDRNPSGSSAGSGAAVAANLCVIAIGTETNGSIVSPASVNGIVGIKPTVGLWSRNGIIPISATQDTAGPMARTVRDAAILLGALAGVDERDPVTEKSKGHSSADYTVFLAADGLKGKRIGVEKKYLSGIGGVVSLYQEAIHLLKKQGAEIVEVELLKLTRPLGNASYQVLQYEFKDGLNRYLAKAAAAGGGATGSGAAGGVIGSGMAAGAAPPTRPFPKSLADIITFNLANQSRVMPYFQQEVLESSEKKGGLDSSEYLEALKTSTGVREIIDNMLREQRLDAICSPTNGAACCIDLINGDYGTGFSFSAPAAMAGYPHITVPMGMVQGLPVGLSFIAGAYQEGPLLGMAYSFEQAMAKRTPPSFTKEFIPG